MKYDLFKNVSELIEDLAKSYILFGNEINTINSKIKEANADIVENQYKFAIEKLDRSITFFKTEMQESLIVYYHQVETNTLSQYTVSHIKDELDKLKKIHKTISKAKVPSELLKDRLGENYLFHIRLNKLTAKKIMEYFEMNYLLHQKKKNKK